MISQNRIIVYCPRRYHHHRNKQMISCNLCFKFCYNTQCVERRHKIMLRRTLDITKPLFTLCNRIDIFTVDIVMTTEAQNNSVSQINGYNINISINYIDKVITTMVIRPLDDPI